MIDLNKIKISASPLTGEIYLYRHGKDPNFALDKRKAEADVIFALIGHMLHDMPDGAEKDVQLGDQKYKIIVKPI